VEEAAQEGIAREAQLEKLEAAKSELEGRAGQLQAKCEQLTRELEESGREMTAVLASNVTLANEMVRLDEGSHVSKQMEALEAKNTALVAQLLASERERVSLMKELESALQMTQGLSARVESDEVERNRSCRKCEW
jgi:chromosome segregation ATPase